jgi:hypothetical protein
MHAIVKANSDTLQRIKVTIITVPFRPPVGICDGTTAQHVHAPVGPAIATAFPTVDGGERVRK